MTHLRPVPKLGEQGTLIVRPHHTTAHRTARADPRRRRRTWSELHERYQGRWQEEVHHGGRVLQALTYRPSGAIIAAPTTSLPEAVGGPRNWDYRYAWVRDAAFALNALWVAACPDEAVAFFDWMAQAAAADSRGRRDLQIMFGVRGEHDLTERELDHLPGWRGSAPVRIGNDAWQQRQLDVAVAYAWTPMWHSAAAHDALTRKVPW